MKVSIIVTVFNNYNYLNDCLDSIINQVYKNLEIIIIDDCSTDNSQDIIKKFANLDNRIIPFYQTENKGINVSRNIGLKAVSGEYIMFVNGNDKLTKEAIRRMIDVANKYNSDFVDTYHLIEYSKNNKLFTFTEKKLPKTVLSLGSINDNNNILKFPSYITGKLMKKSLIDDLLFEDKFKNYDYIPFEFTLRKNIKSYTLLNRPIYIKSKKKDDVQDLINDDSLNYIEVCEIVKNIFLNSSVHINNAAESNLVSNIFIVIFEKNIDNNLDLVKRLLNEIIEVFPNYKTNPKINFFIRKMLEKLNKEDKYLEKIIKRAKKTNFIDLYYSYLNTFNKFILKNPLE